MQARIYQLSKTPGQSSADSNRWAIDFISHHKRIDDVMGWTASDETTPQTRFNFDTMDDAINFANKNGWKFEVIKTEKSRIIKKAYADNFLD